MERERDEDIGSFREGWKASMEAQWQRICLQFRRRGSRPWVAKIPWRKKWQPTPIFLLGKFHGQRSHRQRATVNGVAKELDTA